MIWLACSAFVLAFLGLWLYAAGYFAERPNIRERGKVMAVVGTAMVVSIALTPVVMGFAR